MIKDDLKTLNDNLNVIIGCAFRICFLYFLKCFLPVISLGTIRLSPKNYDHELLEQILIMRSLVQPTLQNTESSDKESNNTMICVEQDSEHHNTNNGNTTIPNDTETNDRDKILYALKIKQIERTDPDPKNFKMSDIYVNKKTRTFHIRTHDGFESFPLIKRSIVQFEKLESRPHIQ